MLHATEALHYLSVACNTSIWAKENIAAVLSAGISLFNEGNLKSANDLCRVSDNYIDLRDTF